MVLTQPRQNVLPGTPNPTLAWRTDWPPTLTQLPAAKKRFDWFWGS
jgi:hypothetical protein